MYPTIVRIYGPFQISSFSLAIAFAIFIFIWLCSKDNLLQKFISKEEFKNLTIETSIIAIIGGRVLHVLSDLQNYKSFLDIISIWNGGLSVLGALFAALIYSFICLKKRNIAILSVLDRAAINIPIIHAIARIGCFLAGCCFGCKTNLSWAITYTNPEVAAPLYTPIHPTQLYSSITYFVIFLFMSYIAQNIFKKQGQLFLIYLILSSLERIIVDFFRGDRIFFEKNLLDYWIRMSLYQWIAFAIILLTLPIFFLITRTKKFHKYEPF